MEPLYKWISGLRKALVTHEAPRQYTTAQVNEQQNF